jgi:hypothetical protein
MIGTGIELWRLNFLDGFGGRNVLLREWVKGLLKNRSYLTTRRHLSHVKALRGMILRQVDGCVAYIGHFYQGASIYGTQDRRHLCVLVHVRSQPVIMPRTVPGEA